MLNHLTGVRRPPDSDAPTPHVSKICDSVGLHHTNEWSRMLELQKNPSAINGTGPSKRSSTRSFRKTSKLF
jgi:hypothetical protein